MSDADQKREDAVLKRMLKTKPKPRKDGKPGRDKPDPDRLPKTR